MGLFSSIGGILGGIGGAFLGGPVGAVIGSGLGGAVGGSVDSNQANKTAQGYYNSQMSFAQQQAQFQQDYAKNVMQWRVEDAKKAGVHPMAALGVSNPSYSPVSSPSAPNYYSSDQFDTGSTFGQSLNRAAFQAKTQQQQVEAVQLSMRGMMLQNQGLELDNQYKSLQINQFASQLQNTAASSAPAPKVNQTEDDRFPHGRSITPGASPLLGAARVGDSILLHINPDIADSITEDFIRTQVANIAAEGQVGRYLPEIAEKLTKPELDAIKRGDAELLYTPPSQFKFAWKSHMMPRKNSDGSISGRIVPFH